ncbi:MULTISPECIES: hypothetical protein [unclassified Paenibacillus]|uniref:hypothetical protein n=1 Tax=unclassified Paenibacillus TaxID=185978 RepID=UPI0030F6F045
MKELQEIPVWIWIILAAVLLLQGTWLFRDARDRGQGMKAWFWGIWGLTGAPSPAVCYLLFVVLPDKRKRKAGRNR